MRWSWRILSNNKVELMLVVLALIAAGILAIVKPFNPLTVGYFADVATVLLIGIAVLLVIVGARRSVV